MKRYKDGLAPREIKEGFYRKIELGKDVVLQRIEISNQLREMIVSHVGLAGTSDTNREAVNAGINLLAYDNILIIKLFHAILPGVFLAHH
jgi:hypothetical protein